MCRHKNTIACFPRHVALLPSQLLFDPWVGVGDVEEWLWGEWGVCGGVVGVREWCESVKVVGV